MPHFWTRATIIAAATAALGACATGPQYPTAEGQAPRAPLTMPTPNFPIVQGQASAATETAVTPAPTSTIESQTLAPPPAAVSSQPLTPISAPAMTTTTRTVTVAGGKVVDAQGKPATYEVQSGDTLYAISRKLGTTAERLAEDNDLSAPFALRPGQVLNGPSVKAKAYVVESGDTLFAISRRFTVGAQDLAAANDMELSAPIRVGQKLMLPGSFKDKGPSTRTVTVEVPAPAPVYQPPVQMAAAPVVQPPAVTMVAAQTTVTPPVAQPTVVAQAPNLRPYTPSASMPRVVTPPPAVTPYIPPVTTPYTPPAAVTAKAYTPAPSTMTTRPSTPAVTAKPYTPSVPQGGMIATNAPPTDGEVARAGSGKFVWPVRGDVVSGFGPKGGGQRNDGLNIKAASGAEVRAAANGEVVYAGDQVPGFGNLVLVKHADGWVTAYAHLSRVDVKMRDAVMQGQQIGQVGATGGVGDPQLHFEVRYAPSPKDKARPVDPQLVLPRS